MQEADLVDQQVSRIVAVVGGARRRDHWLLAPETSVLSVLGRTVLDLRSVTCLASTAEITLTAALGRVTIVVPDGAEVRLSGASYLASSECNVVAGELESPFPRVLVTATTVLGRVHVCSSSTLPVERPPLRQRIGRGRGRSGPVPVGDRAPAPALLVDDDVAPVAPLRFEPYDGPPLPPLERVAPAIDWPEDEDDDDLPPDVPLSQLMGQSSH